jgi:Icc-related predicted phosphoesterase
MRCCAVSDLHGRLPAIPECDVLLIAGDVCPDEYPAKTRYTGWDPELAELEQTNWLKSEYAAWEQTVPAQHILATFGNHDWVTSGPEGLKTQFFIDEEHVIGAARFYFTPWVSIIGNWNFQLDRERRKTRFEEIPSKLDVLVAHSPAHDVLDKVYGAYGEHAGCPELRRVVQQRQPRFMVHGHIHEGQRYGNRAQLGNTTVYNVAMWGEWTPTVFEI